MSKSNHAPLPGEGNARNLVDHGEYQVCPCCGALWRGGHPWTEVTVDSAQLAERLGITRSAVVQRLSRGTLAGYQGVSREWLIPVHVAKAPVG